jgi:hypothetical protein
MTSLEGFTCFDTLHDGCAVYILLFRRIPVYVGQSTKVFDRIPQHERRRMSDKLFQFDEVRIRWTPRDQLREVEAEYIRLLNPIHNNLGRRVVLDAVLGGLLPASSPTAQIVRRF